MRIVIKIGTSTITHPTGRLNIRQMEALCKVLSDLKNAGNEVILVSSGAIGMGVGKLRLGKRPADVPTKQAAAAVGQCELMYTYDKLFSEYRHTVAQILLTADDIADPVRHENFRTRSSACWSWMRFRSSTRTTRFPSQSSASATMIRSRPSSRPAFTPTCSCCCQILTVCTLPTRIKIQTLRASNWFPKSQKKFCALPTARAPSLERAA